MTVCLTSHRPPNHECTHIIYTYTVFSLHPTSPQHYSYHLTINSNINWKPYYTTIEPAQAEVCIVSNVINQWLINNKPSAIVEAIMLTIGVISGWISLPEIVCSWCSIDGFPMAQYYHCQLKIPFPMKTKTMGNY